MKDDFDSIDKLAEQYATNEDEAKAYQQAQKATIINQTKQINEARKKLETLSLQVEQLTIENTRLKTLNPSEKYDVEDSESIALVQLALMNNFSMQRELTLEECKKFEIYTKTLALIRGKKPTEDESGGIDNLSNEELLAAMKSMGQG